MPRTKPHWDIEDPHDLLAYDGAVRRAVRVYAAQNGLTQPEALAELVIAGYASKVSTHQLPPVGGTVASRGGGAAPGRVRPGDAGLRVADRDGRQEQSGSKGKKVA